MQQDYLDAASLNWCVTARHTPPVAFLSSMSGAGRANFLPVVLAAKAPVAAVGMALLYSATGYTANSRYTNGLLFTSARRRPLVRRHTDILHNCWIFAHFIARQPALACRPWYCFSISDFPFVRLSVRGRFCCLNEWTSSHTFWLSDIMGIILVFQSHRRKGKGAYTWYSASS